MFFSKVESAELKKKKKRNDRQFLTYVWVYEREKNKNVRAASWRVSLLEYLFSIHEKRE